ncbi:VOC family protein [Bacillus sp. FJAT-42376]|uniref:VOC family protein n=1 Tax=Bacillus sp. FJAT-42376 TaxID=2014076 RepID=UPI000F4EDA61|nr:VOC family protein [Bacillus sp. FJAT-42376]AZB43088.1 VOC family protein [Bacillus sp. FJAT-42376]
MVLKMSHLGVIVRDLPAAQAFFLDLGLEVQGQWESDGEWMGQGRSPVSCTGMGTPDGQGWIELIKLNTPPDEKRLNPSLENIHMAFSVKDMDAVVAKLKKNGTVILRDIQIYKDTYKLCYCRGPEGMIIELVEQTGS